MRQTFRFLNFTFIAVIAICVGGCSQGGAKATSAAAQKPSGTTPEYTWRQLSQVAPFSKSYNFPLFVAKDSLWAIHPQGTWVTDDGIRWHKTALNNIIRNTAFLKYVQFEGALYGLGTFEGNIERFTLTTQIARTTDMHHWQILAKESNLPKRFFFHPFAFQEKLWIIGGSDGKQEFTDTWNSSDGVVWLQVSKQLPSDARSGQQFVVFKDRIYMLGHDVWASSDGLNWTQVTKRIATDDLFGYAAVVYDDQIWLIGCNRSGKFQNEVLRSEDGEKWISEKASWSPRGAVGAAVYKDGIVITGGKYGGPNPEHPNETEFFYSNDVWRLERK